MTHYLVHAANQLADNARVERKGGKVTVRYDAGTIPDDLAISCKALARLADDDDFFNAVQLSGPAAAELASQFDEFAEEFMRREKALLVAAGFTEKAVDLLLDDLADVRAILREAPSTPPPAQLRPFIENMAAEICDAADFARDVRDRQNDVVNGLKVVGGSAITVVNVFATPILGGVGSAISCTVGGGLAWDGLKDGLLKRKS